jgi:hypothetical protein
MVTVLSSDTEEALDLLSLSPSHGVSSQPSGVIPRNPHRVQVSVATCSRIDSNPMIRPRAFTLH